MLLTGLLVVLAACVEGKKLGGLALGHWTAGMRVETANCEYTFEVQGSATCQQVADLNAMPLQVFQKLNPWLDCGKLLSEFTIVCVPSESSTKQKSVPDGNVSSDNVIVTDKAVISSVATSFTRTTSTTLSSLIPSSPSPSPAPLLASLPSPLPVAPVAIQPPPAFPEVQQPQQPEAPAEPQFAPIEQQPEPQQPQQEQQRVSSISIDANECLSLFNSARAQYNPSIGGLIWSDRLASIAQQSVAFNAGSNCCDASCHILSGGMTGIAQNLFCGVQSCQQAFHGWVTEEAAYQGGHWQNIVGFPTNFPFIGCASSGDGVSALVCNF
ncbi:hypothetical protein BDR26DRAFT_861353, partial [Obelidium mucronatum]